MRVMRFLSVLVGLGLLLAIAGGLAVAYVFWHYGRNLPDFEQLAHYQPPVITRIYAGNGELMGEFARERRLFVPISAVPKRVIDAFVSAEDKNFYNHPGVDLAGIARAIVTDIGSLGGSRRPVGASTITQQVAKNFLLTNEVSLSRKIKEAILAVRIEHAFTKDHILELYLNEIYMGAGAYGVAAASLYYFDKPLDQLTVDEAAFLGALPKGPNNYNPVRFPERSKERRDWVIDRMVENGYVTAAEGAAAKARPLTVKLRSDIRMVKADWFAEEVRRELIERYGEETLYDEGLSVRTSLDPRLQAIADRSYHEGLIAYDRRHGWRGPFGHASAGAGWAERLSKLPVPPGLLESWRFALVLKLDKDAAHIGLADGSEGEIPLSELRWARATKEDQKLGPAVRTPDDVLQVGDLIAVEPLGNAKGKTKDGAERGGDALYGLRQIPNASGGMVVMDPHTGRVLALVGGWDYGLSQFDRATQAMRQPGSAFKPIVYTAALDHGFTPSSLVLDAPFVLDQGPGLPLWRPGNYEHNFLGPTTLRVGLEHSRNLMTIRLAQAIGMDVVADYARRFGVVDNLQQTLAMALGAADTTLMRLTTAYAEFSNDGHRLTPSLIDRIQDRQGKTVFRQDDRPCPDCQVARWDGQSPPVLTDDRAPVVSPATAYQMVAMLEGVAQRGTASALRDLKRPLAGKTGTTNDFFDAWFMGFSPDLVVGTYVGFDTPRTLGHGETGARVALPIFKSFIAAALAGQPAVPFRVPPGVRLVRVNAATGVPAKPGDRDVILEPFKPGTEPFGDRTVLDGSSPDGGGDNQSGDGQGQGGGEESTPAPASGTGGLY